MTAEHAMWLFAWVAVNQGGVPIPVVPSLVAAGALAGAGHASLPTLVAVIVGASLVADLVWYGIGRWARPHVVRLLDRLSGRAAERVKAIVANASKQIVALRIGVKNGGCAGMEYTMEWAEHQRPLDEVVEDRGVKMFIDPKAVLFLLGAEMDYRESMLKSGFIFNNPNQTSACG